MSHRSIGYRLLFALMHKFSQLPRHDRLQIHIIRIKLGKSKKHFMRQPLQKNVQVWHALSRDHIVSPTTHAFIQESNEPNLPLHFLTPCKNYGKVGWDAWVRWSCMTWHSSTAILFIWCQLTTWEDWLWVTKNSRSVKHIAFGLLLLAGG